jgi:TonB family protein
MPRVSAVVAVLCGHLTVAAAAPTAAGQEMPLRLGSAEPGCSNPAVARDTASFTIYLTPPAAAARKPERAEGYALLLHGISSAFQAPTAIRMEAWPGTFYHQPGARESDPDALTCGVGPLTGQVRFTLRKGRARDLGWALVPDSRDVARAIQSAIVRADSLQYFAALPHGQPAGAVRLDVTMTAGTPPAASVPLMKVRMPYIRIETPVQPIHIPPPVYPEAAMRHGIRGEVALQYVVDEHGRVNRSSIRVLEASYQEFIDAAADAIVAGQFRPSRAGGCPVKALVQQRIRFRLR